MELKIKLKLNIVIKQCIVRRKLQKHVKEKQEHNRRK